MSSSPTPASSTLEPIIIYALPGSQYVFKVLAALKSRKIDSFVYFVPVKPEARKAVIPSGGIFVPELQVGTGDAAIIVSDSERILHWFDDNYKSKFFPNEQASELSTRASDKTLAASVWYYNWVDQTGYEKSMRKTFRKYMPSFLPDCVAHFVLDKMLASTRAKFRKQVMAALDIDDSLLDDEPQMRKKLVEELKYFQAFLSLSQEYLLPGHEPTAADFSVYAQLERLVGNGTASDITIPPSLQELKDEEEKTRLERLWQWHDLMRERFPVQFKGKVPNKDFLFKNK